ncbi:GNAT family protein [uncultured Photobacterium sp.]|uniref:GNAT family N-acetyltransferase n=1 Tax=uncultured Photobacterium sp. TaxID=173973 RepID=UPI002627568B|nr:GNAT family protein [uncultured Photobacterium sp.]
MELEYFTKKNSFVLINWVSSAELNYLWSGPVFDFPLTAQQIASHIATPEVIPFILRNEGKPLGYIELVRESTTKYRMCRVLIGDESYRGKGYGKGLVKLAVRYACEVLNAKVVTLAVFENNPVALRCYQSLGFTITGKEMNIRTFNGESWTLLYMEKKIAA